MSRQPRFSVTRLRRVRGTRNSTNATTLQKSENQANGTSALCSPIPVQRYCVYRRCSVEE
jgi:hypothetical protein